MRLEVVIDGKVFTAEMDIVGAPRTTAFLAAALPFHQTVGHAMWSGPLLLTHVPGLASLEREGETTFLAPGTLVVHPRHEELGIAYAPTQFKEPLGGAYVTKVGIIVEKLAELAEAGARVHARGRQSIEIRPAPER